jgi:hypothetical protein
MLTKADFFALGKRACDQQCVDILMWLIEAEVLVDAECTTQDMLLLTHTAITRGYIFVLEWQEEHGVLHQSDTHILRAIEHNQLDSLQFLLCHGMLTTPSNMLSYAFRQAGEREDWTLHDWFVKWLLLMDK